MVIILMTIFNGRHPRPKRTGARFYSKRALNGVNQCAYEGFMQSTINDAVPACHDHLCHQCRMGVGTRYKSGKMWCMKCSDGQDMITLP